ncbi:ribonuclease H family protein [Phocaeicola oris]|uniref:ribonuclease H family protein n=1 Tax=Phocaeicola oris TaxID=2896850 RepID=UPI00234F1BA9|nr:ribonuclease H family protein [Phocaeicola oris]MCE2616064.1 ribonuclease H family protein [Phocaeicola oris]
MARKQKYYVVWKGVSSGIYDSWTDCQLQVKGYKGALYQSFNSKEEAERAFSIPAAVYLKEQAAKRAAKGKRIVPTSKELSKRLPKDFNFNSLAVDAACSGNPGQMEYRGVYLGSEREIFHFGPIFGTNNIGEFLAIVHGLALLKQKNLDMPIYSDSRNALLWVKNKKCKTKLARNAKTEKLFQLIERAENWLNDNEYTTQLLKWETNKWGEIPADFGRK